jgi:hypothetical protein
MKYILFICFLCVAFPCFAKDGGNGGGGESYLTLVEQTKVSVVNRTGCFDCLISVENIPNFIGGYYSEVGGRAEYFYSELNVGTAIDSSAYGAESTTIQRNNKLASKVSGRVDVPLAAESSTSILIQNTAPFERPVILISRGSW